MSTLPVGSSMPEASLPLLAEGGSEGGASLSGEFLGILEALTLGASPLPEGEGEASLLAAGAQQGEKAEEAGESLPVVLGVLNEPLSLPSGEGQEVPPEEGSQEGEGASPIEGEKLDALPELLAEGLPIAQLISGGIPAAGSPEEDPGAEPSGEEGKPFPEGLLRDSSGISRILDNLPEDAGLGEWSPEGAAEGEPGKDTDISPKVVEGAKTPGPERASERPEKVLGPEELFSLKGGKEDIKVEDVRVEVSRESHPPRRPVEVKAEGGREGPAALREEAAGGRGLRAEAFSSDEKVTPEQKAFPRLDLTRQAKSPPPTLSPPPPRGAPEAKPLPLTDAAAVLSVNAEELRVEDKGSSPEAREGTGGRASFSATTPESAPKAGGVEAKAPPSPLRAELHEKVMTQVIEKASLSINGERREVSIRLEPQSLGVVRIHLRLEEGHLSARLMADSPAVRDALQSGIPRLREALTQQGLNVQHFRVDVGDGRGSSFFSGWEGKGEGEPGLGWEARLSEPEEMPVREEPYSSLGPSPGTVNLFI